MLFSFQMESNNRLFSSPLSSIHSVNEAEMRFESSRLDTFRSWPPNAKVEASKIARAGFFRLNSENENAQSNDSNNSNSGEELQVKCGWCGVVISEWDYGDQVSIGLNMRRSFISHFSVLVKVL